MAGGMNKRGSYGSMAERVARGREASAVQAAGPEPPPVRHCWVNGAYGRLPGLLLGWRQVGDAWQGRVVRLVYDDAGWAVVEEWLDAGLLDPA